ncbi:MAG: hypothetical protein AAF307_00080 [Pseudomonadota bacterium]
MVERSFTEDDLRAFVTGNARSELARRIKAKASTDHELGLEIEVMRGMIALAGQDRAEETEDALGWQRLKQTLASQAHTAPSERPPVATPAFGWRAAAVVLGLLALGQGAFIATSGPGDEAARYETASVPTDQHILAVAFADDTQVSAITALLQTHQAILVGGPSVAGLYRLSFANEDAQAQAHAALSASPLIRLVAQE